MRLSPRRRSGGWSLVTARVTECHLKSLLPAVGGRVILAKSGGQSRPEMSWRGVGVAYRMHGVAGREQRSRKIGGNR
jgi:hypothetical protein